MLVRMVLPKVLKGLKDKGPHSCMVVSLDQFAHINQAHGWKVGDRILKESARKLAKLTEDSAELIGIALMEPTLSCWGRWIIMRPAKDLRI